MGRLFWKFFLFFFFAQLVTALAVGAFVQFNASNAIEEGYIDQSPLGYSLLDAAESTLKLGGHQALKELLESWEAEQLMHKVYVVNANDQDVLRRKIKREWLAEAKEHSGKFFESPARIVQAPNGDAYTMFTVFSASRNEGLERHRPERPQDSRRIEPPDRYGPPPDRFGQPPDRFGPPPDRFGPPPRQYRNHRPLLRAINAFPLEALLIAALASALFAAVLAWYFSKPIKALRIAFRQAAEGDLNVRVEGKMGGSKDELSDLGKHFDYMASQLSALLQGQKRLLHHVSHELRSPLARMHMALGLAMQDEGKTTSSLDRIEHEADRMDKLISELLELSRFESGMVNLDKAPFSLNKLLKQIADDASFEAKSKEVEIVLDSTVNIELIAQEELMHRAIENLVRNAVKYSPEGATVTIAAEQNQQYCVLQVSDQGEGVLATELEDIFKPFVRGHSGSQVKGHGVGLAIAKQIVEAHQGTIFAENLSPYGFMVTIKLPI